MLSLLTHISGLTVVYHHGKYASGGHYTVDVLRQDAKEWIHIDDTHVTPVDVEHVRRVQRPDGPAGDFTHYGPSSASGHEGKAYLLLYKREDLAKPPPPLPHNAPAEMQRASTAPMNGTLHRPVPQHAAQQKKPQPQKAAAAATPAAQAPAAQTQKSKVPGASVAAAASIPGAAPASPKKAARPPVPGAAPVATGGSSSKKSAAAASTASPATKSTA